MKPSSAGLSSLDRALDILEYLYSAGGESSLTAIAQALGIYKSGVHRALQTLKARGFVVQDTATGHYGLGPRLFVLGSLVAENLGPAKALRPHAQRISAQYGECVHINMPYDDDGGGLPRQLVVDKIQSPGSVLTISPGVGRVTLCHASASGKCVLAFLSAEELANYQKLNLTALTPNTITNWPILLEQLAEIRKKGYATEDGETEIGLSCIGVPCFWGGGRLWGVLSISGPTSRIRALDTAAVVADLKAAARSL